MFSILTCSYSPVVVALADELSGAVDKLAAKHYVAIRHAIRAFRSNLSISRELALHDALRLNQVTFSPRTLWLAREGATEASVTWIDKRISGGFDELLTAGIGDLRELARLVGNDKVIKFDTFRGHRESLPVGGWASNINIGSLRAKRAEEVLRNPHEWPGDLVQRAVEAVEDRMLVGLAPIGQVADADKWFGN